MKRSEKLSIEFGRQIAIAISKVFTMEESGVFTIRRVEVLNDFSVTNVWISRIGGEEDFFSRLEHAKSRVSSIVYQNIKMKKTPKLVFIEDNTGEYTDNIDRLLQNK
jgi:ribosome-binding factor A